MEEAIARAKESKDCLCLLECIINRCGQSAVARLRAKGGGVGGVAGDSQPRLDKGCRLGLVTEGCLEGLQTPSSPYRCRLSGAAGAVRTHEAPCTCVKTCARRAPPPLPSLQGRLQQRAAGMGRPCGCQQCSPTQWQLMEGGWFDGALGADSESGGIPCPCMSPFVGTVMDVVRGTHTDAALSSRPLK